MNRWKFIAALFGIGTLAKAQGPAQWNQCEADQNHICTGMKKALNGQCPVCGTMAEPWKFAKVIRKLGNEPMGCGSMMVEEDGEVHIPACEGKHSRITRCARCNAAFYQSAQ